MLFSKIKLRGVILRRGELSEVEGLVVCFDRIAFRLPGRQSAFEKLDAQETQSASSLQDLSTGFIAGASAVNNRVFSFGMSEGFCSTSLGGILFALGMISELASKSSGWRTSNRSIS